MSYDVSLVKQSCYQSGLTRGQRQDKLWVETLNWCFENFPRILTRGLACQELFHTNLGEIIFIFIFIWAIITVRAESHICVLLSHNYNVLDERYEIAKFCLGRVQKLN